VEIRYRLLGAAVAVLSLLPAVGCGSTEEIVATSDGAAPFTTTVNLTADNVAPICGEEPCWLPVQHRPQLEVGSLGLTRQEVWPMAGARVLVTCEVTGQQIQDRRLVVSNRWLGIFVPYEQYNQVPATVGLESAEDLDGNKGIRGYVSDLWLTDTGQSAPPC